ncbi:hypothetical protein [Vallitalea okinawensis]|uniref:hypothetical protein n=1 Tax=Vallitalea okinawensis TaxID=2078660 RepID=UPI000CFBCAF5|nr:hypothetical protein [Vallitalea okinawensis]
MREVKHYNVGEYRMELIIPGHKLDGTLVNNLTIYNDVKKSVWNIEELLKAYSDENGYKYFNELYFDIHIVADNKIYCVGFNKHCEIDLNTMRIVKTIINR